MIDGIAIIKKLLKESSSCWVTRGQLINYFSKFGGRIEDLKPLILNRQIIYYEAEELFTLPWIAHYESKVAEEICRLMYKCPPKQFSKDAVFSVIREYEQKKNSGRELHIGQKEAVFTVVNNNFSIITGGPGTGKTTVLTCAAYVMRKLLPGISIAFTAPTGKAANRLAESSGENTCTVHKKFHVQEKDTEQVGMVEDVLIIDESSMCDLSLMAKVLPQLRDRQRVVLVGDTDQLPSVGCGAILRDAIASNVIPLARLTKTFRQDNSSVLFTNIVNIREGRIPTASGADFHAHCLKPTVTGDQIRGMILKSYIEGVKKYGLENVCVLLPYRKSGICSNGMSSFLQPYVNKQEKALSYEHKEYADEDEQKGNITGMYHISFKKGDLVMQLVNRDECANGDIGKVVSIHDNGLVAEFYGKAVEYNGDELNQLALAYSMTVNKSQGSEYPYVVMVLLNSHKAMLNRNILYTGITRAKKEVVLITQADAISTAVKVKADTDRKTLLKEKLIALSAKYKYVYNIRTA